MEVAQENRPVLCSELPLKTKNSKRAVVLADFVLDEILLERQRYEKRKASDPEFLDLGYICCHENGQCHNRSFYIKSYNRLDGTERDLPATLEKIPEYLCHSPRTVPGQHENDL